MAKKNKTNKKQKHNRGLKTLSVFLTILIILVAIILVGYNYLVDNLLSEIGFFNLDRANIGINENAIKVDGVKTVLLLGTDSGDLTQDGRTDVIMLASVNTKLKTLKLISIPRDTMVEIKDIGEEQINHAYHYGGAELMLYTINSNFDLHVDDYALIDYSGLAKIVDAVGGIDLELVDGEIDFINSRVAETVRDGNIMTSETYLEAVEGIVHLNGVQAVTHARNRSITIDEFKQSDFGRTARQRDIIEAIINQANKKQINELMNIAKGFLSSVETSMPKDKILGYLLEFGVNKNSYMNEIKSYQNPSYETESGYSSHGGNRITPYFDVTKELFNQYINEE